MPFSMTWLSVTNPRLKPIRNRTTIRYPTNDGFDVR